MNLLRFSKQILQSIGLVLLAVASITSADEQQPTMVIIIDDLGYSLANGLGAVNLPGPITLAIMPHTPHGALLARQGAAVNKEIMLHVPMQNHAGLRLGPGGLTLNMTEQKFKQTLLNNVASIPYVEGINNHMGSALTEQRLPMQWTMDVAAELGLFFVDSRTSAQSVAWQQAQAQKVPALKRNVFLDNDTSAEALERQFQQAISIAQKHGSSVLIGHPYPTTVAFLEKSLGKLDEAGIKLASASALIRELKPHLNAL
ncbi:MAG: divergent polysaccharide deacetylase family protein [Gammaproteobacteria bacterium]|nr:divergent polysaccharide deacetylase family protein [Gammaproteobacteria bacterium]